MREMFSSPAGVTLMGAFSAAVLSLARAKSCDVHTAPFGAVGDAQTLNTRAIQRALDSPECDVVVIPFPGVYKTGALNLTSNTILEVNGVLLGSSRPEDYPVVPALPSYGTCRDANYPPEHAYGRHQALLSGWGIRNVTVRGDGVIDGGGAAWWARFYSKTLDFGRPRLLEPMFCQDFTVHSVQLKDSAFWHLHPYACDRVHVRDVRITAPRDERAPNTDGIDPDSTTNVLIERVIVDVGDNSMAIKSGYNEWGAKFARPSANIHIRDSFFVSASWAIGSEMSGGVYNVTVENCVFGDPYQRTWKAGAIVKSARGRGGEVRNITIRNSKFHVGSRDPSGVPGTPAIAATMFYPDPNYPHDHPVMHNLPKFRDFKFENINVEGSDERIHTAQFLGLQNSPIQGIILRNVSVPGPSKGWLCAAVSDIQVQELVNPTGLPNECPNYPVPDEEQDPENPLGFLFGNTKAVPPVKHEVSTISISPQVSQAPGKSVVQATSQVHTSADTAVSQLLQSELSLLNQLRVLCLSAGGLLIFATVCKSVFKGVAKQVIRARANSLQTPQATSLTSRKIPETVGRFDIHSGHAQQMDANLSLWELFLRARNYRPKKVSGDLNGDALREAKAPLLPTISSATPSSMGARICSAPSLQQLGKIREDEP